jgi:hypothetical protein
MGLDVYVGSLTRYFSGDWLTVLQQAAASGLGPPVVVVRPEETEEGVTDPDEIRSGVLAWRDRLSRALAEHTQTSLDWDERADAPYFTDKPAWDCFGALVLWAAYAEHPELTRPHANPLCLPDQRTGDWHDDPAFRRSRGERLGRGSDSSWETSRSGYPRTTTSLSRRSG